MYPLGCALTFGVLLDTFVVRPVLVPAYMIWAGGGGFHRLDARTAAGRNAVAHRR